MVQTRGLWAVALLAFASVGSLGQEPPALILSLPAHSRAAGCVRFSPDGKRLAVGYEDGTVVLCDALTVKVWSVKQLLGR